MIFCTNLSSAEGIPSGRFLLLFFFVDEGGSFTMQVRQRCNMRQSRKVFDIKGIYGEDRPFISPPKKMKILSPDGSYIGSCWQYQLGVDSGKQTIMDDLKVQTPGAHFCHFPLRDDYGEAYFNGLLSETHVYDASKKHPWQWVKIPGHERNEPLDCRNYANAAFKALPKNLDAIDRQLTRFDLSDMLKQMEEIEQKIDELEAALSGAGARKIVGIVPRNW